jgi:hypothetical protein
MNKKGIVVKILENSIIVLVDNNQRLELKKNNNVYLGQEIFFNDSEIIKNEKKNSSYKIIIILALLTTLTAIIINIFFDSSSSNNNNNKAEATEEPVDIYAYIDFNLDPSVEFAISEDNKILEVKSFDEKGSYLLDNTETKDLTLEEATENLITEMKKIGYITEGKIDSYLMISGSLLNNSSSDEDDPIISILKTVLKTTISTESSLKKIDVIKSNQELREESIKEKLSVGIYTIMEEAKKQNLELEKESFSDNLTDSINSIEIKDISVFNYTKPDIKLNINVDNKSAINEGDNVPITIESSDKEIESIDIYLNDKKQETLESQKYDINLENLSIGKYTVKAEINYTNGIPGIVSDTFEIVEFSGPKGEGNGLTGYYFDNKKLENSPTNNRIDALINFNWGNEGPFDKKDKFSVKWFGYIEAVYSENYTFFITSDDGCRLKINDQTLIDQWNDHSATEFNGNITLESAEKYKIEIDYYDSGGGAQINLMWKSISQSKELVPQKYLYTEN